MSNEVVSQEPELTEVVEIEVIQKADINAPLELNLKLLGTIVGKESKSAAFILNPDSGESKLCKIADKVFGSKVVQILCGRVVLKKEDFERELVLRNGTRRVGVNNHDVLPPGNVTEIQIAKSDIRKNLRKANELFSKIKFFSVKNKGTKKLKGFRVSNVPIGSIVERAGIKDGDIICSIANQKIESIKDAMKAFSLVKNESQIRVSLLRNGKILNLRYSITN